MANLRSGVSRAILGLSPVARSFSPIVSRVHCERALEPAGSSPSARQHGHGEALRLAVAQPPPDRAEHVGIIVGPDPLVLVRLLQRPSLSRPQLANRGRLPPPAHDRRPENI